MVPPSALVQTFKLFVLLTQPVLPALNIIHYHTLLNMHLYHGLISSPLLCDFTVINDSLLLCKFCDTVVNWKKKTRIYEHLQTRMHSEKKEAKLSRKCQKSETNQENRESSFEEPAFEFSQELLELEEQDTLASKINFLTLIRALVRGGMGL